MSIKKDIFGFIGEKEVLIYTLKNKSGATVTVTTYGGALVNIIVPDKNGNFGDVILGYDTLQGYITGTSHQGALVGRCANRIDIGKFTLNGKVYELDKNDNGINHIHGGKTGYNTRVWDVLYTLDSDSPSLSLTYTDPDSTEGYDGTVNINVIYTLTEDNAVKIEYFANTDKPTVANFTNHTYFNLNGYDSGDVLAHEIQIFADKFTPSRKDLIPTGEIRTVKGTALDFTSPKAIGRDINSDEEQMIFGGGYDHNFITGDDKVMKHIVNVREPVSGRIMDVYSDQPAVQLYTGNFLDGQIGKNGVPMNKRTGFCLETQHTPNSINMPQFPSVVLTPDDEYHYTTIYKFSHE